jgi:hypothetical protein
MAKRGERRPFQIRLYAHGATRPGFRQAFGSPDEAAANLRRSCYITGPEGAGDAGRVGWARGEVVDSRSGEVLATRTPDDVDADAAEEDAR